MTKSLVIVESPSKASIINRYLGEDYIVKASVGHIRDLQPKTTDKKAKTKTGAKKGTKVKKEDPIFNAMGLYPEDHWHANYEIMPDKTKVVSDLKKYAKECDKIYLATDLDREGEAIAWHLKEVLGGEDSKYWRVKYPEITKNAIKKAFDNPEQINMDLVNAQQTRRFLDRIVGYMVSPVLWSKVSRGLSAGRVQSVAVELIVDREHEIKSFIPKEYWTIDAHTKTSKKEDLVLNLTHIDNKKAEIPNQKEASIIEVNLQKGKFTVSLVESKDGTQHAPAPFTTSTLQQSANQKLGFSVKRTMMVAQRLYESGFITYMRTDSVNLSADAIAAARDLIEKNFGKDYLPEKPNYYKSKESAQEAHEAIRPSHPEILFNSLPSTVDRDGQRLYKLIYDRYLACQMSPLKYESNVITVQNGIYTLKANGRRIIFDGFRRVWGQSSEDIILPLVKVGDTLTLKEIVKAQHFTNPPARFSEATLVKELEKDGIGRPSTYASIIGTIQDRGYVKIERGRFYAEKMGEIVTFLLRQSFKDLMDPAFTASMEDNLDNIASGKQDWIKALDSFYSKFKKELDVAKLPAEEGGMPENSPIEIKEITCPQCGKYKMALHSGRTGNFLACQGFYDKSVKASERCKKTLNLTEIDLNKFNDKDLSEEQETALLRERKRCNVCGAVMDSFILDEQTKIYLCSDMPKCHNYEIEHGNFKDEIDRGPVIICEKCGSDMVLKEGRFGKYMACTNEACGNTRKILKSGEVAPPKEDPVDLPELLCKAEGAHYVLRDGASGIFLAAHSFPKVRETRPPFVCELKRFRDRISPKFYYLADGPEVDDEGNSVQVRFSRKSKEQYLAAVDSKGQMTGWVATYNKDTKLWEVQKAKESKTTKSKSKKK